MPITKSICYAAFKDVANKYMDPGEADNFMLEHEQRVKELMAKETLKTQAEAEAEVAKEMANERIAEAVLAKRNAAQQTLKTLSRLSWIKQNYEPHEYVEALKHMLGGTQGKRRPGSSNNVASKMEAYRAKAESSFVNELKRNGYEKYWADPKNELDIMIELAELREGGMPGRSGSETAKEIAEIMSRHQEFWRVEANKNGAFIEKLPGYSIAQTHDPDKLIPRKGETVDKAFERWKEFILPKLDIARTFRGQKNQDKILRDIWNGLTSGVHLDYTNGIGIATGGNRAQRLSNSRKLHFKDGESFYAYNKEYGSGSMVSGYMQGLDRLSKNSALMSEMGVNPEKMIDDLNTALKISASRSKDPRAIRSMTLGEMTTHWDPGVYNLFVNLTGKNAIPGSQTVAKVAQVLRGVNSMARLGMATISSFSDIATQMNYAMFLGISRSESLGNMVKVLGDVTRKGMTLAEKQCIESFGLLSETLAMQLHDAVNMGTVGNGWLAKAQNRYFRLIGLDWWTSSLKKAMALSVTHDIGEFLAKDGNFAKDFKHTMQKTLAAYNLGEKEMEVLKQMPLLKEGNRNFIDVNYVHNIPDEAIAKYLGIDAKSPGFDTKVKNTKTDLEMKLRTFMHDQIAAGVIEPDLQTKAWLNQGTQAGTIPGEALRSVAQFKSFAVSIITKTVNPWLFNSNSFAEGAMGIAELVMTTTALGYLAMSCKDAVRGKTPMELSPQSMTRALLQGGALGLAGDILFGDANTNSITASLAGPVPAMVDDLYHIYTKATDWEDEDRNVAAEAIKRLRNYLPGQNIFYMKLPLDYLLMYRLQEYANPGYLNRLETNLHNKTGQEYWLSPGYFVK